MSRETVASRILTRLVRSNATDQEMARDLDLPEASVRRTRRQLHLDKQVFCHSYANPMVWSLYPLVDTFVAKADEDVDNCVDTY